ncbi:amino acid ABC transporter substrate-binding protein [Pseudomonas anguilliseptica]|uniref:amino acid ABC transporter substrate-binding protein n=1 Tax=Pseudomonas anguilliseptica TaxID=53406 RepID=UPI0022B019CD|nr:amino acid ABC transporter substrate-binding protein [Pseudomonas anguilliseptica]MCZ4320704.1 amino acid ABC transporter substrate-binding protein [Pseudomonas anguilliseptica]
MNGQLLKPINLLLACLLALPPLASASTLERVRSSNSLTLGYLPDIAPFSSQQGGQPSGYAIDLCEQVAAHIKSELGLADLQVRYQAVEEAESIAAVSAGSIDILCSPTLETLTERKAVSFSLPIYTAGLAALVREDASPALVNVLNGKVAHSGPTWRATINRGLANHTYAVTEGGATEAWVRQQQNQLGVVATLVTVANPEQGVQLVADGKADAFFSERILLQNYLAKNKDASEMRVLERIYEFAPVAMALARDDEDLRLLVDTALSESYRSGELENIYRRHLGEPGEMVKVLFKVYALPR